MHKIRGLTSIIGLLGKDVLYSQSPLIHNYSASLLGNNSIYLPFNLKNESLLKTFLDLAWELDFLGMNVTQPYKEKIAHLVHSNGLHSVNTLYRGSDWWCGTSTDGVGFERSLLRKGFSLEDFSNFIFLGNGGVVFSLLDQIINKSKEGHNAKISILRRSNLRDEVYHSRYSSQKIELRDFNSTILQNILACNSDFSLVIQATSAPLKGECLTEFSSAITPSFHGVIMDLNYSTVSSLISRAEDFGIANDDGTAMLIEQAIATQKIWWGKSAEFHTINDFLKKNAGSGT